MAKFSPPENFDFLRPKAWPEWRSRFMRFASVTKLIKKDSEVQMSTLIYSMGAAAEAVFKTFEFDEGEAVELSIVLEKFDALFISPRNTIHERAVFRLFASAPRLLEQKQGEPVEAYVGRLYDGAEHCKSPDKDDNIRDHMVTGLLDKKLSMDLKSDLTTAAGHTDG